MIRTDCPSCRPRANPRVTRAVLRDNAYVVFPIKYDAISTDYQLSRRLGVNFLTARIRLKLDRHSFHLQKVSVVQGNYPHRGLMACNTASIDYFRNRTEKCAVRLRDSLWRARVSWKKIDSQDECIIRRTERFGTNFSCLRKSKDHHCGSPGDQSNRSVTITQSCDNQSNNQSLKQRV